MNNSFNDISRRDFMKLCSAAAAAAGLSGMFGAEKIAEAMEAAAIGAAAKKPPVIWLEGLSCTGCTHSLISMEDPTPWSLILDKISLRYHETIMAAAGYTAEKAKDEAIKEGGYILVVEGAIPGADDRYCVLGGRPFKDIVKEAAKNAEAIICAGNCSAFGGLPVSMPAKGLPVSDFVKDKPIINLSTCPVHMDHLYGTIMYYLVTKKVPELDKHNRPLMYFGAYIHDNCRRRAHFDAGEFLTDWNNPDQKEWCLFEKGCKGTETYSDCPIRRWNNGISFCIDAGAPCQGCAEPNFYEQHTPLYKSL
jgi:hydrogenase small subunit